MLNVDTPESFKTKVVSRNCTNIIVTSFLFFRMVLFCRRRLDSDQYCETYRKTLKYEKTLDHARRP